MVGGPYEKLATHQCLFQLLRDRGLAPVVARYVGLILVRHVGHTLLDTTSQVIVYDLHDDICMPRVTLWHITTIRNQKEWLFHQSQLSLKRTLAVWCCGAARAHNHHL